MSWQINSLVLAVLGLLLLSAAADNSVHIWSKYQLITSTTLNWLPRAHYDSSRQIVVGGFESQETEDEPYNNQAEKSDRKKPLYVCRVLHNAVWVAGTQRAEEKQCTVTIHGSVKSYDKYELLENVDDAARLNWEHWDKYRQMPPGVAVAAEKTYVARCAAEDQKEDDMDESLAKYTHFIGTLMSGDGFGSISYVKADGSEGTAKSGDVLVETEPIYYDLTRAKLNWPKKRVLKRTPRVLGAATITNNGDKPGTMGQAFGYSYKYSDYWGQGRAILKGLNISITLINGTSLPKIMWGTPKEDNRTDVYTVEIFLEPGTGVNVTLKANYTDMEVPYSGNLVSHYEDDATKNRGIVGIRREVTMVDVTPDFGPIYFLDNYTLVPTTTMAPTTEPTTTTQPPPESDKETHKQEQQHDMEKVDHDENMIIPPKKSDMSNMQSDDGGPLSLKNKVEVPQSASSILRPSLILVPLLALVAHRIT